ncbi:hypothetical protein [Coleofasciculus sp. F4-SAH-05]|uniref:hypothetical protein n=1 Tax=Coleofasciculus sp. F4-SAH-05 TaxID=3069525 RepID=UPI003303C6EA
MAGQFPPIYFYIPQPYWQDNFPDRADENWQGFGLGIYAWTLQTYLRLKADGFPCELVQEFPDAGIVLIHRNALRSHNDTLKPGRNVLLICLKAELRPYPYAQLHLVQNPLETQITTNSYYIPHWTQPGLIPRDPGRGDRVETIAFFGHEMNLAPELLHPSWQKHLDTLGLQWQPIINRNHWSDYRHIDPRCHDYSQVDVIVAVRRFDHHPEIPRHPYLHKPATKLYNAWLAGVPAVLGVESAYQAERISPQDYLEVTSFEETLSALKRLKGDRRLYQAMVNQGKRRAATIHPSATTAKWRKFLTDIAIPAYYHWCNQSRFSQHLSFQRNALIFNLERVKQKILNKVQMTNDQ